MQKIIFYSKFHLYSCYVNDLVSKEVLLEGKVNQGIYVFNLKLQKTQSIVSSSITFVSQYIDIFLWYNGSINKKVVCVSC